MLEVMKAVSAPWYLPPPPFIYGEIKDIVDETFSKLLDRAMPSRSKSILLILQNTSCFSMR